MAPDRNMDRRNTLPRLCAPLATTRRFERANRSHLRLVAHVRIVAGAWLRWSEPREAADLKPRPDALEYEEGARSLARGDGYLLVIDGKSYPLRYPPGLSLLIAASFPFTGSEPGVGTLMPEPRRVSPNSRSYLEFDIAPNSP